MILDCADVLRLQDEESSDDLPRTVPEYRPVLSMPILGSLVSHNGSTEQCSCEAKDKMRARFFANFTKALLMCDLKRRLLWLDINILSIVACRWNTWPYNPAMANRLDKTQVHMVCLLLNYHHKNGICIDSYYRNRCILAGRHCGTSGRWSVKWASAVLRWNAHCHRARDINMWHSRILNYRPAAWLEAQRAKHGRGVIKRTKTRLHSGKIACRWSECLDTALEVCPAWSIVTHESALHVRTLLAALVADT